MSARFRLKYSPGARQPWKLRDAARPAFLGQYSTLDVACRAMDNTIRREAGMPERIAVSAAEVQAAMRQRASVDPSHHVGQHLQGCRACYAYTEGRVSGSER